MDRYSKHRQWALTIKPGDKVRPVHAWNASTRNRSDHLPDEVVVQRVNAECTSQTCVMFDVRTLGGEIRALDAGWFSRPDNWTPPEENQE